MVRTIRYSVMASASAIALCTGATSIAATEQPAQQEQTLKKHDLDIPAQPLAGALTTLVQQSGESILAQPDITQGKQSDEISGSYTVPEALGHMLKSSGLKYHYRDERRSYLVTAQLAEAMGVTSNDVAMNDAGDDPRLIRVAQVSEQNEEETAEEEDEDERSRDEIIVTGTNIRGIAPESSPTRTFTREDVQISGAGTAQDFIQTLTTNFGGGSNEEFTSLPDDANVSANAGAGGSMGSSINLRGLGSGSTLVLLNGHRLAPSSGIGDFVDISMIPASAIDRVEILTDGASSIYGGDAVAGVVNFILRDDFEGIETSFRYGIGTQRRSAEEFRASVTGGLNWDSGHALVSYEYFNQDEISAADRLFSQTALLPRDLTPSQERHSVLGSISQDLTSNLEVFTDVSFSKRDAVREFTNVSGMVFRDAPSSENLNISAGGTWKVADTWFLDLSGTYSEVSTAGSRFDLVSAVERSVDSKIWVADVKTSGPILRLPSGDLKIALGGHFRTEDFKNVNITDDEIDVQIDRNVFAAFGELFIPIVGPDNALPGIKRLELNVSGRYADYSDFGSTANPKVGVLWSPTNALALRSSYSTSFKPPPLGRVGDTDFSLSAVQTAFINAVFGLTPGDPSIADVVSLTGFGISQSLDAENSRAFTAGLDFDQQWGHHDVEMSMTWFDIKFENRLGRTPIPGSTGVFDAPNIAFNNPDAFPEGTVIFMPSSDQISELVNRASTIRSNFPPVFGDPFDAEIINLAPVIRNLSLTLVSGFDFDFVYTYESAIGDLLFGFDGTYLQDFKQQAAVTTPEVELVSTRFNPVDLKLRGRAGYAHNGLNANVFVNYVNDYRVDNTANAMRIGSWTTVDLSLSYDTLNRVGNSILDDTVFRLSVINLFDEDPPSAPSAPDFGIFGYDPTNSSPLGRFIAFEVTKRF